MNLLQLQVDSPSANILADNLTHEVIADVYSGLNPQGIVSENETTNTNLVVVEDVSDAVVIIAAYDTKQVQKWHLETQTPCALARILVQKLGLKCENGVYDSLFA